MDFTFFDRFSLLSQKNERRDCLMFATLLTLCANSLWDFKSIDRTFQQKLVLLRSLHSDIVGSFSSSAFSRFLVDELRMQFNDARHTCSHFRALWGYRFYFAQFSSHWKMRLSYITSFRQTLKQSKWSQSGDQIFFRCLRRCRSFFCRLLHS